MVDSIRGYRVVGEYKADRQLSVSYLQLKTEGAKALAALKSKVADEELKREKGEGPGVPCVRDPEPFIGDDLMSDREAQLACAPCGAKYECELYRLLGKPAHGVYAGTVKRMDIPEDD